MSVPKLYYFDIMGRAEMIRLVLAAAGKPFKDIRFSFEEWPKSYQKKSPFGLCPWVEIDGEVFGQSVAIATYFARQNDLYGKTDKECLQIDQLLNVIQDFLALSTKIFKETDKDKKVNDSLKA
ncbi:glutathione S-transferase 1-like [Aplysia californica]|uniref:Glutathione S-transferase 1-like n=1 Tax=Aplysia californica TaxID=6500 RepID=A0ABM1VYT0_APLCA|nr:glutathione S-transferase 1-like [Aplysia californica]